jgi:hypothetical protein
MAKTKIPEDIKKKADKIIADFNLTNFEKDSDIGYYPVYKSDFLYLNRREGENEEPIARLRYNGKINKWDFAIFKWSNERYDPDEFFFPGSQHLNGTIEGALKAGTEAYPPEYIPSDEEILEFIKRISGKHDIKK